METDTNPIVLSHYQLQHILKRDGNAGETVPISTDLGLRVSTATIAKYGIQFSSGQLLSWEAAHAIAEAENSCFTLHEGEIEKIARYSTHTNRAYSLMPTPGAPTLLISGLPMHRIKHTTPDRDTHEKIKAIGSIKGQVLDTSTGLGYTAIQASRSADRVITIELDPVVLEICQQNPWSVDLFQSPNIEQLVGDSGELVCEFEDQTFERIIHDPPTISLAGHLYGRAFYDELHRILKPGGRLFHYIGDPDSRSGKRTTAGVVQRLQEAGFKQVQPRRWAFGVVAGRR